MIRLQGTYVPAGAVGFFFLWALHPEVTAPAPGGPGAAGLLSGVRGRERRPRRCSQVVTPDLLLDAVRGVPAVHEARCTVYLPDPRGGGLQPFWVPGLALAVADAAQWLLHLEPSLTGTELVPAHSLMAWRAVARALMAELAQGRLLPDLRTEAGVLVAGWTPIAPTAAEAARWARLQAALPEVCRAVVPPDRSHRLYRFPTAGELIQTFRTTAVDRLVRRFLRAMDLANNLTDRSAAVQQWLRALGGQREADLPPGLGDAQALYRAVQSWRAPAVGVDGAAALRTGLRLQPPDATGHGQWELELVVEAPGDPPPVLSAQAVWEALGQDLTVDGVRFSGAEQRLLSDLPAMARLFPPLEPLRFDPTPIRLAVEDAAVQALLAGGADALKEAGYPVYLPAGLARAGALRARMHLRPAGGARESQFGLSQLVEVQWDLALGENAISRAELERMAREKRPLVQHRGRWVLVDPQVLAGALRNLGPHRKRMELGAALRLAPEVEETTAEGWVADLLARLREPARLEPVPVPRGFRGSLRPYQQRGLNWLAFLRRFGLGALLADDMGLGKTVQVIALLLHEREQGLAASPTLLVCPVSLVGNWRRELARFAPSLRVLIHHGSGRAGGEAFQALAGQHDVVITTYALAARDAGDLAGVDWAGVVADEAQAMKNPDTQHARALRELPVGYRVALTGTPVENHLGDLWSLFAFLNPGLLGSREWFRRRFALPIERDRDPEATDRLKALVAPLILRRVKSDPGIIQDLPEKLEHTVVANLTPEQAALYEAVVQETLEQAATAEGIQRHGAVLAGLTRLKQVCNHPAAVTGDTGPLQGRSGKLDRLTEMLDEVLSAGDQALIFTQFARFGARLQAFLSRLFGRPVLFLDGGTPRTERERRIAQFQAGEAPLFILSLKAGGVGLNLTAANHVFHFDRWWNPAVEDQATDRAYRIGQDRRVMVHKLLTAGTLEERIDRLLAEKRELSAAVIGAGESWLGRLSTAELRALIALEQE